MSNTILITGACGYLGPAVLNEISQSRPGSTLRILDNMESGRYSTLMALLPGANIEFIEADVVDTATLHTVLKDVHTVIHLAAKYPSLISFENSSLLEQVNHWGTAHLIQACLKLGVRHVIYTSAASVYGDGGPHAENALLRPIGSYASSCCRAENEVMRARERGLNFTILRLGTIYGYSTNTDFDNFINRFILSAALKKPLVVNGDGCQMRPIIHIEDAARIIGFATSNKETFNSVLNCASENISVLHAAETITSIQPASRIHFIEQDFRTHISFTLECTRLLDLGWRAQFSLADGAKALMKRLSGVRAVEYDKL